MTNKIKISLDWTPNTVHAGIFVAQFEDYFAEQGIEVEIIHPGDDNYVKYPIEKVREGIVDIGMAPSEHVIQYNTQKTADLLSVATVFQGEASHYVAHNNAGITSPKDFDGKTFACYGTHLEEVIFENVLKNAGGVGNFNTLKPQKLDLWTLFMQKKADVAWVFSNWETAQATHAGVELVSFKLNDYGVPYGYSPVFITDKQRTGQLPLQKFMAAVAMGYQLAATNPNKVAQIMANNIDHPNCNDAGFLAYSINTVANLFLNEQGQWGVQNEKTWSNYTAWLTRNNLIKNGKSQVLNLPVKVVKTWFTNEFV